MRLLMRTFAAVGALATVAFLVLGSGVLDQMLFEKVARSRLNFANDKWSAADGLTVLFCGTGSPLPSAKRAQACVAVVAGDRFFLVDAGTGSWETILQEQLPIASLDGVFLTHFHSDHIGDLSEVNLGSWVGGRSAHLTVYGPPGVTRVVSGIEEAFALDDGYRTAHHGEAVASPRSQRMIAERFEMPPPSAETVVFEEDGLRVIAFAVDHGPVEPSVGYRFERDGRSVVITGDTAPTESVRFASEGADLLIHEAQANHMVQVMEREAKASGDERIAKILFDIQDYHTTPIDAAVIANEADVELLILYHLTPAPDNAIARRLFLRGVSAVRPRGVEIAEDGMSVRLPAEGAVRVKKP